MSNNVHMIISRNDQRGFRSHGTKHLEKPVSGLDKKSTNNAIILNIFERFFYMIWNRQNLLNVS